MHGRRGSEGDVSASQSAVKGWQGFRGTLRAEEAATIGLHMHGEAHESQ